MRATIPITMWLWIVTIPALACVANQVQIDIPKPIYRPGEHVIAVIRAPGEVGIENDIEQRSFTATIGGIRQVDLGPIKKPGLYVIRVVSGSHATAAVLFAYSEGEHIVLKVSTWTTDSPLPLRAELIDRFSRAITQERLLACAKKALIRWLPANVSTLGTTTTVCMVCVVPGGQVACPACVSSAGDNVVDLSLEILTELVNSMEQDRIFSAQEAKELRAVIGLLHTGRAALAIMSAGSNLERVVEGVNYTVQTLVENEAATLVVGNVAGQVNKTIDHL